MAIRIARRQFIATLGGLVAARPIAARTQPSERRIGILIGGPYKLAERRAQALVEGLRERGWIEGRNIRFDYRAVGEVEGMRGAAAEIVGLAPDVIVANSNAFVSALRQVNRGIPTVFVQIGDPVGSGFVDNLARPGGVITGFNAFEPEIAGKWLQILVEIAPRVTRVLLLMNPETAAHVAMTRAVEAAASASGVKLTSAAVHNGAEIEQVIRLLEPAGGSLIVLPHSVMGTNRDLIAELALRYKLPAVFPFREWIGTNGGLMAYGPDVIDLFRRSADYVDRILRGANPGDLPVQNPNKYELVINNKTAKALGIEVPATMLARADEVIE
jgi:putative ABC transport system substrate-binding protein